MIMDFWDNNNMIKSLFLFSLLLHATMAQRHALPNKPVGPQVPAAIPAQKWSTLSGNEPLVIARGGFTGLFPEGNPDAIGLSKDISTFLCNLQLTKDAGAYCLTGTTLDNSTTIAFFDPKENTYKINGNDVRGHFSFDYTGAQIDQNVSVNQAIFSRPGFFDGMSPVLNVDALLSDKAPPKFWLNVQNEALYTQHGLKVVDIVLEILKVYPIDFVSSSEIGFLKSINGKTNKATKVIFQLLQAIDVEPTTRKPYGEIVKDLLNIKSFASGIMVPKQYIWPVKPDKYLALPTTLVADAHKLGLEVYVSGFANDLFSSYNYSYDPTAEYLQFVDKEFSVDGVVTDFPATASNAIACFAHNNTLPQKGPTLIISRDGASGVYPGSTDLAYNQAIVDGADIIDCSVQMTKDGIAFCSTSIDLIGITTAMTKFMSRSSTVPELQARSGIFSFDLTWSEIQTLKPQIVSTQGNDFQRNPAEKNSGKFVTLPEFLELAKAKAVTGILVNISNAAYLASKKGLDIVGAISTALSNATFDKQSTQQVLIQSDDSSVLSKFKDIPAFKRVLYIGEIIGDAPRPTIDEIKKHADAVNLPKTSLIKVTSASVLSGMTNVAKELKDANLTVFVHTLRNEYTSLAFDYWSDPNIEIATYVQTARVDGFITDFPATASRYLRSPCSDPKHVPTILPAQPGELLSTIPVEILPPEGSPLPPLKVENVVDPPLPAVVNVTKDVPAASAAAVAPSSSTAPANVSNIALSLLAILVLAMLSASH
ncbi:PREDICTED: glycerophosphodiester phosphodiesterase GDPDL7-like [Lupinus angustifolius]|uniref:glycerophosphodiester phosphodiesterase GDPDL7-like n=1 Tax=Lupinus angustifolius TaxID=3871 RepID=UPI00092F2EE9|nr:PREDICTED: glycerophosphodiester phosphodiesterase GDPDL7-like [Lupinus angustifolius]